MYIFSTSISTCSVFRFLTWMSENPKFDTSIQNLCLSLSKRKWEGGAKHSRAFFNDLLLAHEPFIQASVRLKQLLLVKRAIPDISTILSLLRVFLTSLVPNGILVIFMLWIIPKMHESASHHSNYLNDYFGTRIPSILSIEQYFAFVLEKNPIIS